MADQRNEISQYEKQRKKIRSGIEVLIEVIVTPGPNELIRKKLFNYAMKLLESNLKPAYDNENIYSKISKQMLAINKNAAPKLKQDMNNKLQILVHKLSKINSLKNPNLIMRLLCSLSKPVHPTATTGQPQHQPNSIIMQGRPATFQPMTSKYDSNTSSISTASSPTDDSDILLREYLLYALDRRNAYFRDPAILSLDDLDCCALRRLRLVLSCQAESILGSLLTTAVNLKKVRRWCHAISDHNRPIDGRSMIEELVPSHGSREAVKKEIAAVVSDIDRYIERMLSLFEEETVGYRTRSVSPDQGPNPKMDLELHEESQENSLERSFNTPLKYQVPKNQKLPSLFDIWKQLYDIADILTYLGILVDSCDTVPDFHCISVFGVWRQSGCPKMVSIANEMIHSISLPFIDACLAWANRGEIINPSFMIERIPGMQDIWKENYRLCHEKIPYVFDVDISKLIFYLGSNRNLIRRVDKSRSEDILPVLKLHRLPDDRDIEACKRELVRLHSESALALVDVFIKKSSIVEHLTFLKGAMFMERGDFVDSLLVRLTPILDLQAKDVYYHDVMPLFDELAKKSTLARNSKKLGKTLGRLGVKILEATEGDSGWDIFCIEYQFPDLLKFIFDPQVSLKLMRIWHHLFKIKRNIFRMNEQWLEQKQLIKKANEHDVFYRLLMRCNMIRSHMAQFLQNLGGYIFYEVIEPHFSMFMNSMHKSESLYKMRKSGHGLVDRLLKDALIDRDELNLFKIVSDLLNLTDRYLRAFKLIMKYGLTRVADGLELNEDFPVIKCSKMIQTIWDSYESTYQMFLGALNEHPTTRNLSFKFDFNEYHARSMAKEIPTN